VPQLKPRVVILGAGFAGLQATKTLRRAPVEITLIDGRNYHCFQPLLYQVATAGPFDGQDHKLVMTQASARQTAAEPAGTPESINGLAYSDDRSGCFHLLVRMTEVRSFSAGRTARGRT